MFFTDFIENLKNQLFQPLPGAEAHSRMATQARLLMQPNEKTRESAVLILFYPIHEQPHFVCILRPPYDGVHGGQMAFPGGRQERFDKDLIQTALREAQEEIGIKASDVQVLGKLTSIYIPPSNYNVLPVVGYLSYRPDFYPDAREVEQIFEIALSKIIGNKIIDTTHITINGHTFETPFYKIENQKVWGATAMMISELIDIIKA